MNGILRNQPDWRGRQRDPPLFTFVTTPWLAVPGPSTPGASRCARNSRRQNYRFGGEVEIRVIETGSRRPAFVDVGLLRWQNPSVLLTDRTQWGHRSYGLGNSATAVSSLTVLFVVTPQRRTSWDVNALKLDVASSASSLATMTTRRRVFDYEKLM